MSTDGSVSKRRLYAAAVIAVFLLAVFVRVFRFGAVPGGMNQDGAMAAVDAVALAEHGTDRLGMRWPVHLTAWGFGQMSALLSYLQAPFIKLFGLSVVTARIPQLLASLAGLLILWLFAKDSFSRRTALTVLFFAAINPWHILQSRWALDCNLFPHFLTAGMFFLNLAASGRRKTLNLCVSMLCFALSMYCYGISIYTVPLFLILAGIYLLRRKSVSPAQLLLCVGVFLAVSWPFIFCMAINALGLDTIEMALFTIPRFYSSVRSADILFFSPHPLAQLKANALCTLKILFQFYGGLPWNEVRGFGTMYVFSIPFIILGGVKIFSRIRKSVPCALTAFMFITAVWDGLITAGVNINRINLLFYPLIIMAGVGTASVSARFSPAKYILPCLYLAAFCLFCGRYFGPYADEISEYFMEDFGQALTAVSESPADRIYITADSQYRGYSHVSEILTLFYHDIDAEYYRSPAFKEKYAFSVPPEPDGSENAVYVVRDYELERFDPESCDFQQFGRFYTVTKKP